MCDIFVCLMEKMQELQFKFSLCLNGGKSYVLVNETDEYFIRLESALNDIKQGKGEECDYLFFAFVTLCSATLEYSLNLMLSVHCFNKYHVPLYLDRLQDYENYHFRDKIIKTPSIVSGGKFVVNDKSLPIKRLTKLVNKRNLLLHNSNFVKAQTFTSPNTHALMTEKGVFIPISSLTNDLSLEIPIRIRNNDVTSLSAEWCIEVGEALLQYRKCVISPFLSHLAFEENEILVRNRKQKRSGKRHV